MNFRRPKREMVQLEMTPLIDVIFQLLIFFLVTTTFVVTPGMAIQRPRASNSAPLDQKGYTVEIPKKGTEGVVFQGRPMTFAQLKAELVALKQSNPDLQINIGADEAVAHKRVVNVMDTITGAGFQRIGIITSPGVEPKKWDLQSWRRRSFLLPILSWVSTLRCHSETRLP